MAKKSAKKKANNPFDEYVTRPYKTFISVEGSDENCTHYEVLTYVDGGMVGTCTLCGRVKEYRAKVVGEVIREHAVQKRRR